MSRARAKIRWETANDRVMLPTVGGHLVDVRDDVVTVRVEKRPNELHSLALQTTIPAGSHKGQQYKIMCRSGTKRSKRSVGQPWSTA